MRYNTAIEHVETLFGTWIDNTSFIIPGIPETFQTAGRFISHRNETREIRSLDDFVSFIGDHR